jgi:hypothetical protein
MQEFATFIVLLIILVTGVWMGSYAREATFVNSCDKHGHYIISNSKAITCTVNEEYVVQK